MAARADNDIKADIISELEDVEYLDTGVSLLDAFVVESVIVASGRADILLVFDDEVTVEERDGVVASIREVLEDIDGLFLPVIEGANRSALAEEEPNLLHPRPGSTADATDLLASLPPGAIPTEALEEPRPKLSAPSEAGELTLGGLISIAAEGVPVEEIEAPGFDFVAEAPAAVASSGMTVYSGGGCGAGTTSVVFDEPAAAPKPAAVPVAALTPKVVSLGVGKSAPRADPQPSSAQRGASVSEGQITIDLERYTELVRAEQTLEMLPTLEDVVELEREVATLRERLRLLDRLLERG